MEEIAHGVDEDPPRLSPRSGLIDFVAVYREVEAVFVAGISHCLQPVGHGLRIAELAALGDFGAAGGWVPGLVGPFDAGGFSRRSVPGFRRRARAM